MLQYIGAYKIKLLNITGSLHASTILRLELTIASTGIVL